MERRVLAPRVSFAAWSWLVAGAVVCFPLSLHQVDFRGAFGQGLSVSAHKSSPAYAAFEDLQEKYESDFPELPDGPLLAAGHAFTWQPQIYAGAIHQVTLKGMTIGHPKPEMETQPVYVARAATPAVPQRIHMAAQSLKDDNGQLLPLAQRRQILLDQLQDEDWTVPSPSAMARQLVRDELAKHNTVEQTLRTPSGASIYVRSVRPLPQELADNVQTPPAYTASLAARDVSAMNLRPLWLAGQIEMTGGLAFTGPQSQMVIRRVFDGQSFEQGRIWVSEGKFEIRVKEATGYLVAELISDGRIQGRGELSLLDLSGIPDKDDHVSDIRIALRPTTDGVAVRTLSGYSHGNQLMAMNNARVEIQAYTDPQKVNEEGIVTEPTLSRDSSFVARAMAPGHWPSLIVGQARNGQDVRLFANSLMDALINLNTANIDKPEVLKQGVVWGRLTQNTRALPGAQVELAGGYQPIYLNDAYLPDPALRATSKNGLFAILKVKPGVQALRVRLGDKVYPAQVFPTEMKHVSYVELEVQDKVVSQFRVFDGRFMNKPVSAQIRLVGNDDTLNVGAGGFVQYSLAANPFMVEADGGVEYEPSRVTITGAPHVINVPLVQREWLAQLAFQRKIQQAADRGMIVGYMDTQDFEVELTGYPSSEAMQIVYFDRHGEIVEGKTGVAGGGFAIFNAPHGLQTLYVHPAQSRETFSQVVVAEPQFVQVITH